VADQARDEQLSPQRVPPRQRQGVMHQHRVPQRPVDHAVEDVRQHLALITGSSRTVRAVAGPGSFWGVGRRKARGSQNLKGEAGEGGRGGGGGGKKRGGGGGGGGEEEKGRGRRPKKIN